MQLQFRKDLLECMQRIKGEVQVQEETQELRLTEDLPDIGSVLGAWGQTVIRGKEWRGGSMEVSCGVMVWALYQPEDGAQPQTVEAWIPFQFKWDLPSGDLDGRMIVSCLLRSVDARVTAARKLMLRATLSAMCEAWIPSRLEYCVPENVPEDIHLLKRTYPVMLPREAGEKAFLMDEELTLPSNAPKADKLLRFSLQPELIEHKVLSGKVAFRGIVLAHILYQTEDGALRSWDFELPMAQYADLERDYEQSAEARVELAVTALEMEMDGEGRMHLQAGLTGQYMIAARADLELVEDAYSPYRAVQAQQEKLLLPAILELQLQTLHGEVSTAVELNRVVDTAFYPEPPQLSRSGDTVEAAFSGQLQLLFYNEAGALQGHTLKWKESRTLPAADSAQVRLTVAPSGQPQTVPGGIKADSLLCMETTADQGYPMISGLEMGDIQPPDPDRPSLILRRAGKQTLWQLAKQTGSTEDAIRRANGLESEPAEDQMLLIPIA